MQSPLLRFMLVWLLCLGSAHAESPDDLPDRVEQWMEHVVLLLTGPAWCTGVVIDNQGTVATAYHCVASGLRTEIRTRKGGYYIGKMIAADPKNDVALVSAPELGAFMKGMPIREDAPRQGESVYGLGHPFAPAAGRTLAMEGMLQWSVTAGIVSAVGPRLIQTDTALNPGNSGGPVVDGQGRIVGIASRKLSGDNVAFLSAASNLKKLQESKWKPSLLGGQFTFGLTSISPAEAHSVPALGLMLGMVFRDRVVVQGALGGGRAARGYAMEQTWAWSPTTELIGAVRQRFGRGTWSSALDVGAGVLSSTTWSSEYDDQSHTWTFFQNPAELGLEVFGRFHIGGLGLRYIVMPQGRASLTSDPTASAFRAQEDRDERTPSYLLALDIDLPGVFATF
jgi:S1-C subfamily serine protease